MTKPFESLVGVETDRREYSMHRLLVAELARREETIGDVIWSSLTPSLLMNIRPCEGSTGFLMAWTDKYVYCNVNDWEYDPYVISLSRNPPQEQEGANANG